MWNRTFCATLCARLNSANNALEQNVVIDKKTRTTNSRLGVVFTLFGYFHEFSTKPREPLKIFPTNWHFCAKKWQTIRFADLNKTISRVELTMPLKLLSGLQVNALAEVFATGYARVNEHWTKCFRRDVVRAAVSTTLPDSNRYCGKKQAGRVTVRTGVCSSRSTCCEAYMSERVFSSFCIFTGILWERKHTMRAFR